MSEVNKIQASADNHKKIETLLYSLFLMGLILIGAFISKLPTIIGIISVIVLLVLLGVAVGYTLLIKRSSENEKE